MAVPPARAQENVVASFTGADSTTTGFFRTQDRWEVRWAATARVMITLHAADGAVLAAVSGAGTGFFYQPRGGSCYLQVNPLDKSPVTWQVRVVELAATDLSIDPPRPGPAPQAAGPAAPAPAGSVATTSSAPSAVTPSASVSSSTSAGAGPAKLTLDQERAIVVIKGDSAEGTGFFVKTPEGPAVITNQHVIAANPHLRILTSAGTPVTVLSLKGASDRDLALFVIQDAHYSYLDLGTDIDHVVATGDEVITPGNGEGGEVVLNTTGRSWASDRTRSKSAIRSITATAAGPFSTPRAERSSAWSRKAPGSA